MGKQLRFFNAPTKNQHIRGGTWMPVWPLYLQFLYNFDLSKAGFTVQNIMVSLAQLSNGITTGSSYWQPPENLLARW